MRVESSKNAAHADKKDKSNFKTEKTVFDSTPQKTLDVVKTPPASAFSKILEEARAENGKSKNDPGKTDEAQVNDKIRAAEEDPLDKMLENLDEPEEKHSDEQGGEQSSGDDGTGSFNANIFVSDQKNLAENAPAARAILHVADLERIVSYVRTQTLKDSREVLIALRNSVLKGLQIKLTLDDDGNFKAEFLAQDEHIGKQIRKRERELADILRRRSSKFTSVSVAISD